MSETRAPYNLRPEELHQERIDQEDTDRVELLLTMRAGHIQIANAIGKYLRLTEKTTITKKQRS